MTLQFAQEKLAQVLFEITPLLHMQAEEVDHRVGFRPVNMNWELYDVLERADMLRIFTARAERALVGYLIVVISPDLHARGERVAADDLFFLHPDHRKGMVAQKFVAHVEGALKADGLAEFYISTTTRKPMDAFMRRMGYEMVETKYRKVL